MSEGFHHHRLVKTLIDHLETELDGGLDVLLADVPGWRSSEKPPRIGNFVPDVWALSNRRIFIGEAKIKSDLETDRSHRQLRCFLEHVAYSPPGSLLLLAVPRYVVPYAKAVLHSLDGGAHETWTVIGFEPLRP